MPNFIPVLPEIFLLSMTCLILVADLYLGKDRKGIVYLLTQVTLVVTAIIVWAVKSTEKEVVMWGQFVNDPMSTLLNVFICLCAAIVFIYSKDYLEDREMNKGEYYVLGLFAILGMMVMVSAHTMLSVYMGLELLSLSMYAMVAFNRDNAASSEADVKYFVLGAIASSMLLYGMSLIYGVTGSLNLAEIAQALTQPQELPTILSLGVVFIVVGIAFKLGAVPFHMWVPDVYQGAPTAVTLFIGSVPKIAAFALVMRLLVDGMSALATDWQPMLMLLVVASVAIGNVVAIAQTNIKRMLAYSTISHIGFLLLGVIAANEAGYSASMFYTIVYTLMTMGVFGLLLILSRKGFEAENINDLKGLNDRNPWYALLMLILMFSMAGVPPTVGFYAKFAVLQAVINEGFVWLAIVAVLFSVIGAFYYLRIIKMMYFDAPEDTSEISVKLDTHVVFSLNGLVILMLGLFPEKLIIWCQNSIGIG